MTAALNGVLFSGYCSQSRAFFDRTSGLTGTRKRLYDRMIRGLVADGVWAKLDALYILAAPDTATALLNLVSSNFPAVVTGSPTFAADRGYTGTGATGAYISSGLTPNSGTHLYAQDSASFGAYVLSSRTTSQAWSAIGSDNSKNSIIDPNLFNEIRWAVNETGLNTGTASANAQGFWAVTRTASTTSVVYKNGASVASSANASSGLDTVALTILARGAATPDLNSGDEQSAAFIGSGLTAADASSLARRINDYHKALSINVF